jgi:hypothetical protein
MNPQPNKFVPALYGGVIMALISTIPFVSFINCLCCAGILLGGFLSVMFYKNSFPPGAPLLVAGDCMVVGLYAGLIGATLGSMLSMLFLAMFGNVAGEIIQRLIENMNLQIPPDSLKAFQESVAESPSVKSFMIQLVTNLVMYSVFGLLGGLIGYSVFKPRVMAPMPPPAPPGMA